jgi:hypothetical protein
MRKKFVRFAQDSNMFLSNQSSYNASRFDYTACEYVSIRRVETMIEHMEIESTCLHKDSHEAQEQLQTDGGVKEGTWGWTQRSVFL